jgi:heat shock protein HtpX
MHRYHVRRTIQAARLSKFEEQSLVTTPLLLLAAVVLAMVNHSAGGPARALALIGLAVLAICAGVRGVRLYRAGASASMPASVARVPVRTRPRLISTTATAVLALVLPAATCVALLAILEWSWLPLAAVLLLGGLGLVLRAARSHEGDRVYRRDVPPAACRLLERLCMRADMPVPELVLEAGPTGNAWTTGGRIHLTHRLLELLDDSELEAVLAHELAHLANRDAGTMDVCSAPSRMLLAFVGIVIPSVRGWFRLAVMHGQWVGGATLGLTIFCVPPAFLFGWMSRLSVLGMSRSREFAADAAASALTGRPSALASALTKLDEDCGLTPRADLRQLEARAMLCILGTDHSRLGRLFCTHPRTAERVRRLQELEERVQANRG